MAERFPILPGVRTSQPRGFETYWDVRPCTVLDPFAGSGTVGVVCARENRAFVGIELNPEYVEMARERIGRVMRVADDERRQGIFEYG
jgi:16S rRNA G966 N2-methylase RsmD